MKNFLAGQALGLTLFAAAFGQTEMSIAQVQGGGDRSPHIGQTVRVTGIVTARVRTGFFLQTPDDKQDRDPKTSEGIFVFTRTDPPAEAVPGNAVSVTGTVEEYRRDNEPASLTITEVSMRKDPDEIKIASRGNELPKPVAVTLSDLMPNRVEQLERFEGMRVRLDDMTVAAPTGGRVDIKSGTASSDGVFYGVLKPAARPFREPGIDIRDLAVMPELATIKADRAKVPIFDSNPELIRIDSDEQIAAGVVDLGTTGSGENKGRAALTANFFAEAINIAATLEIKSLTGVMHYASGRYTVLTDPGIKPEVSGTIRPNPLPVPGERQFMVAGMNIENFFDDRDDPDIKEDVVTPEAFEARLKKISRAVREFMQMPDVIGIVEAENLSALKRLAQKINSDAAGAGRPDPKYDAYLIDGNDGRGIDNGFLVKTARVSVVEVKQLGKADKYKNPVTGEDNFLNDRPPLMLRASIKDPAGGKPFQFTAIVNHMKSFLGYNDPRQKDNVRLKKKLQAEFLAKAVQARQKADPAERIILLGDFNAFQFNDGIVDMIGTIKGAPAGPAEVLMPSEDLVEPNLINLVDVIDIKQRYSYIFDGSAQVLDHIIVNETLRRHTSGFGYARLNADFPEVFRNDNSRLERFSDHDPAVAIFTFDDLSAPRK